MKKSELKKLIREEIHKIIHERYNPSLDSKYLQNMLKDLYLYSKRNKEMDLAKFYDELRKKLSISYPDGEISKVDIEDVAYSPQMKKLTNKIPDWTIDSLFD